MRYRPDLATSCQGLELEAELLGLVSPLIFMSKLLPAAFSAARPEEMVTTLPVGTQEKPGEKVADWQVRLPTLNSSGIVRVKLVLLAYLFSEVHPIV